MTCSSCAQPLPEGARFCPSCGTPQFTGRDAPGDEERRVVSVLFADLVGFTALSEHRDPERVKRMIDEVFEQLLGVIETHGGVIDKVLGDAIIALFGAPIAHEDDADRAVRAGLAMQDVLRVFRQQHPDDPIELRVGVNTGEVLVGTVAGTDYTAMGDVVNTAARLQQLAVAGSVYIGDPTRQLASPAIRFRALDAVRLRGRTQDTRVWEALEVVSSPTSRHWVSDVPFVGRTTELSMLRSVASIVASERSAIVAVSGEAGIGKSRLVHEAVEAFVRDHPTTLVIEGSCAPYGESNVWWPVAGALLTRLGFDRGGTPDEVRRRVTRRLRGVELFEAGSSKHTRMVELVLHLLGQPSGLDALGPIATRDAVFAGMVAALQRRTVHGPVVVWVDDVQWAAPLLLELLESVARQVVSSPVLIITTHRPDEQSPLTWPPASDPALTLHLSLEALDDAESARLVGYASGRDLPPDVVERVSSRSGGNPLFLIELARLAGGDATDSDDLPGSLRALIAARLDQLSPSQRSMLDNAAVLGNSGRIKSLRNFSAALGQHYDVDDIAVLHDSGLLVVDGQHWRFRSDVVREVAYHTLTKLARAQRHAGIVRHLMEFEPSEIDRIAHHAASAAELRDELGPIVAVPDDIARLAVSCLMESARRWFDQGAHRFGLQLIERALALPEQAPAVHRALLLLQVEALVESHDLAEARSLIADLAKRSEEAGDRVVRGETHRFLGTIEQQQGNLVTARAELGAAVSVFRDLDDVCHLAEALRARGFAEIFGGSLADADWFLGEAEALFESTSDERGIAWVQQHRAWVSFLSGDHAESRRRLERAITAFDELGDRSGLNWSRGLLAYVHHFSRRNDEALELASTVLGESRHWGDPWGAAMMLELQASVHLWRGEIGLATDLAERALAGFRKIDDRFGRIQSLGTLTRAYAAAGRLAEADRAVEEVMVLSDSFGELAYPMMAAAGAAMHLGRGGRAAELAGEAVHHLDTTGANVDEGRVVHAVGQLLGGDADGALASLVDVDVEASPFALAARATARVLIGDRRGALDDVVAVERWPWVSYWDDVVASVAGAVAADGEEAARRCDALRRRMAGLEDVVMRAFVDDVLRRLGRCEPVENLDADREANASTHDDGTTPSADQPPAQPPFGEWADLATQLVPGPV